MNTAITNKITAANDKAQYDEYAKQLIAQKLILAYILVQTIDEFKGMQPEDVVSRIEGEPLIGVVPALQEKGQRIHPTQKPVALYEWLLMKYAKEGWREYRKQGILPYIILCGKTLYPESEIQALLTGNYRKPIIDGTVSQGEGTAS